MHSYFYNIVQSHEETNQKRPEKYLTKINVNQILVITVKKNYKTKVNKIINEIEIIENWVFSDIWQDPKEQFERIFLCSSQKKGKKGI